MIYLIGISLLLIIIIYLIYNKQFKKIQQVYTPLDLAKYICSIYDLNNIQLQKVLLYLQIQYLRQYKSSLFTELFIKDKNYFVIKSVYQYFCGFGSMPIFYKFPEKIPLDKDIQFFILNELDSVLNSEIDNIYNILYNYNLEIISINDIKKIYIK